MPVTQQLARLTPTELAACRASVAELDRLCSFQLRPKGDYLDLDWSPSPLGRAAAIVDSEWATAITKALSGGSEINPAYRDHDNTIWEHPVRTVELETVRAIAATFDRFHPEHVASALPRSAESARQLVGLDDLQEHPAEYLGRHYEALRSFYLTSSDRGLVVANWWD